MTNVRMLQTLAKQAVEYYEIKRRDNKEEFYYHKDNTPQWVIDMTRTAHVDGEVMPNDWIYNFVVGALFRISECDTEEEIEERINEIEPSIYNSDLLAWVGSNLYFAEYVNEAIQEYGMDNFDLFTALQYGQTRQRQEVAYGVLNSLKEQLKEAK